MPSVSICFVSSNDLSNLRSKFVQFQLLFIIYLIGNKMQGFLGSNLALLGICYLQILLVFEVEFVYVIRVLVPTRIRPYVITNISLVVLSKDKIGFSC